MLSFTRLRSRLFYGWIVVATFFVAAAILMGIRFSFGVFFKSIELQFGLTRTGTSSIISIASLLTGLFAITGGWASDRYGPRIVLLIIGIFTVLGMLLTSQTSALWQLFITYSLLLSVGFGAFSPVMISTVSRWFNKKRGLALGVTTAGSGLGTVFMAPLATYLIDRYDWRISFIVLGLLAGLLVVPLSQLLKKEPSEIGAFLDGGPPISQDTGFKEESVSKVGLSLLQALRTRNFWLFAPVWVAFPSCSFLVTTHIIPHAIDLGFTAGQAASILSLISGAITAGRIFFGIASDRIGRRFTAMLCTSTMAGSLLLLVWLHELWALYLFALIYGLSFGGFNTSSGALVADIFGLSGIGMIFGGLAIAFGIGSAAGPALGGFVFDTTNSYSLAFLIETAVMLLATLLLALIKPATAVISGGNTNNPSLE